VRVVGVNHIRPEAPGKPGQARGGGRGPVAAKSEFVHVDARGSRARSQNATAAAGERDLVPACPHPQRGEQRLVLSPAPPGGGVDVQDPHAGGGVAARASSRSFAIFA
jgi:hypothetical protein